MMSLAVVDHQAPVPPPAYQRAQARLGPALHIDALTLVTTLHLLLLKKIHIHAPEQAAPFILLDGQRPAIQLDLFS